MSVVGRGIDIKPSVEPSQSVEGYWAVIRGGEVLLMTPHIEEARAVCRRLAAGEPDRNEAAARCLEPAAAG